MRSEGARGAFYRRTARCRGPVRRRAFTCCHRAQEELGWCLRSCWTRSRAGERKRGSGGSFQSRARVRPRTGARGRPARVRGHPQEGEGGGGQRRGVLRTPRRIEWREGEARGGRGRLIGGGYSAGMHCSALWSTPIACQGMPLACWTRPPCLGGHVRSKQVCCGLGCPGYPMEEERG